VSVEQIETRRLTGSRIGPDDFERLRSLYQDADVAATLGGLRGDTWVAERFAFELAHWETHGFGAWMFVDGGSGEFVGRGALRHARILDGDRIELGYALVAPSWGSGLATEMAGAMARVARDELRLRELAAWTLRTNRGSQRVLEKTGFTYEREFEHAGEPHRLYRLVFPR